MPISDRTERRPLPGCCPATPAPAPSGASASRPAGDRRPRGGRVARIFRRLARLAALRRQRQALAEMEESRLEDLGISPEEARREAARPPWDVPAHWRR